MEIILKNLLKMPIAKEDVLLASQSNTSFSMQVGTTRERNRNKKRVCQNWYILFSILSLPCLRH